MSDQLVGVEAQGAVALIELRRSEHRNAVNPDLCAALEQAVGEVNADESISAVVLSGAGRSFCAGADMKERLGSADASAAVFRAVRGASRTVRALGVPTIAAVHGHALGAGLELAAACDYRVVEKGTMLGIPEVAQGITSGGGILALSSLVSRGVLARLAYGAEQFDAQQALEFGMVEEVVDQETARARAVEIAENFARHPRAALVAAKVAVRAATEIAYPQQWQMLGLLQETLEGGPAQRAALDRLRG